MSAESGTRRAVAAAVRHPADPDRLLLVRRPPDDPELPGVWGLPAASLAPGESAEQAVVRIGREKLGVELRPLGALERGEALRPGQRLEMELWAAALVGGEPRVPQPRPGVTQPRPGVTQYVDLRWGEPAELAAGAEAGSLCCRLALAASGIGRA